jgi:plastocyanin
MLPIRIAILAALAFVPAAALAQPAASQVVDVWSFGFGPKPLHLRAGQPVTLTFVNRSGSSHDFTAPAFFAASRAAGGPALPSEIDLAPHQSRSVTLVPARGTYEAHCSHFLHKQMGMQEVIVVE